MAINVEITRDDSLYLSCYQSNEYFVINNLIPWDEYVVIIVFSYSWGESRSLYCALS